MDGESEQNHVHMSSLNLVDVRATTPSLDVGISLKINKAVYYCLMSLLII